MEDELDPFAAVLLEGGHDLPDRLILLGVEPLLPPHHEVGGPGAERRQHDRRSENSDLLVHVPPPFALPRSISLLPVHGKDAHDIWANRSS